jgi:hypothetical protein
MFLIEAVKEGRTQCRVERPLFIYDTPLYDAPKLYTMEIQKMLDTKLHNSKIKD